MIAVEVVKLIRRHEKRYVQWFDDKFQINFSKNNKTEIQKKKLLSAHSDHLEVMEEEVTKH